MGNLNIAVTGAGGFIGSHLLQELKRKDFSITIFDHQKHSLFKPKILKKFVEDKDIIFHLAGANRDINSNLVKVNTLGTLGLLEAIREYGSPGLKLFFTSSFQVYPQLTQKKLIDENCKLEPISVYGFSKKFAEELIEFYSLNYGLKSIIFRLSNVYGPGCRPFYNSVIATFSHQIANEEELVVSGTGKQVRDFVYVKDVVSAYLKAIDFNPQPVEIFNICSGTPTSLNKIINTLEEVSPKKIKVEYNRFKQEKLTYTLGDNKMAKKILGWQPETSMKKGLSETLKSFL